MPLARHHAEGIPLVAGWASQGLRRRRYGNYLIFYRIGQDTIDVVRVLHGARDYDKLLGEVRD